MSMIEMLLGQMMNRPDVQNNPMAQNVIKMYQNHDTQGLQQMAQNMCRERGINLENYLQEFQKYFR